MLTSTHPSIPTLRVLAAAACLTVACQDTHPRDTGTTTSGTTCPDAGVEGCPCIPGGLCVAGLVCIDQVCEPEDQGGTAGGASTGATKTPPDMGGGGSGTGGPPPTGSCADACGTESPDGCWCDASCIDYDDCCPDFEDVCTGLCQSNGDCGPGEVCSLFQGACVPALGHTYAVVVDWWADYTDVCWDFGACASPDPYYNLYVGGDWAFTSSTKWDTTSASWSTTAEVTIEDGVALSIKMWDEDISSDDWILTWCFRDPYDNTCTNPSATTLHDGVWSGDVDGQGSGVYEFTVRFSPL